MAALGRKWTFRIASPSVVLDLWLPLLTGRRIGDAVLGLISRDYRTGELKKFTER